MDKVNRIIALMQNAPQTVRFADLSLVCEYYFGKPRNKASSHYVYKMPWVGDPRINIQKTKGGKAKTYQVKQALLAISKLKDIKNGQS